MQFQDLLRVYKEYIDIFNNWETTKDETIDQYNMERLMKIYIYLTDILEKNGIIEKYGIKKYRIIESGEII